MQTQEQSKKKKKSILLLFAFGVFAFGVVFIIGSIIFLAPILGPTVFPTDYMRSMNKGLQMWSDNREEAEETIREAIALAKEKKAPISEQMQMRRDYARCLYNSGEGEDGDKQLEEAIAICPQPPAKNSKEADVLTHAYQDIGNDKFYRHMEDPSLPIGIEEQEKSFNIAREAFGPDHEQTIYKEALLPVMYIESGDKAKAHKIMLECQNAVTKPSAKECTWYVFAYDARLAEMEHDYKRAVESFKHAISVSSGDDQTNRIWSELNLGVSKPTIEDHEFDTVREMLQKKQYDKLDDWYSQLEKSQKQQADGSWKTNAFLTKLLDDEAISDSDFQQRIFEAKTWLKTKPKSVTARILLAKLYIDYGWFARGHEYGDQVSKQGWSNFDKRISQGKETLDADKEIKNNSARAYSLYSQIALAQGMPKNEFLSLVEECHKKYPKYLPIDQSATNFLLERWYGKRLETEEFIEKRANQIGGNEGDKAYAQLVWSERPYLENLFAAQSPIQWSRVKKGFKQIFREFPQDQNAKSTYFSLCQQANDPEAVALAFN